jgi:hypothetical protein
MTPEELFFTKVLPQFSPLMAVVIYIIFKVWTDYLSPKLTTSIKSEESKIKAEESKMASGLKTEEKFLDLAIETWTAFKDELPRIRETSGKVMDLIKDELPKIRETSEKVIQLIHHTTELQNDLAVRLEEGRTSQNNQTANLKIIEEKINLHATNQKIIEDKIGLIYKQNTEHEAILSKKLEVIEKKIDNLVGNKKRPSPVKS